MKFFLDKNIAILQKKCEVSKDDLWRLFELVTHLTVKKEITLDDAERYTYILFKLLEQAEKNL